MQAESTILERNAVAEDRAAVWTRVAVQAIGVVFFALATGWALAADLTANVTLAMSADRVFLADGSVIKCTLLCRGKESVVVLVGDKEMIFPASTVLRIERGSLAGERKSYKTEPVAGHEQITGIAEENVPQKPAIEPAAGKPRPADRRHPRDRKENKGKAPFAGRVEKKQESKDQKKPLQLPANIDAAQVRKILKETGTEDIIKTIEMLKKRFGMDKN